MRNTFLMEMHRKQQKKTAIKWRVGKMLQNTTKILNNTWCYLKHYATCNFA